MTSGQQESELNFRVKATKSKLNPDAKSFFYKPHIPATGARAYDTLTLTNGDASTEDDAGDGSFQHFPVSDSLLPASSREECADIGCGLSKATDAESSHHQADDAGGGPPQAAKDQGDASAASTNMTDEAKKSVEAWAEKSNVASAKKSDAISTASKHASPPQNVVENGFDDEEEESEDGAKTGTDEQDDAKTNTDDGHSNKERTNKKDSARTSKDQIDAEDGAETSADIKKGGAQSSKAGLKEDAGNDAKASTDEKKDDAKACTNDKEDCAQTSTNDNEDTVNDAKASTNKEDNAKASTGNNEDSAKAIADLKNTECAAEVEDGAKTSTDKEDGAKASTDNKKGKNKDGAQASANQRDAGDGSIASTSTGRTGLPTQPTSELRKLLLYQLEFYFSRDNLEQDHYLQSQMDGDQYVSIATVANFNQVVRLTRNIDLIVDVLKSSDHVQVDSTGTKVRPKYNRSVLMLREIPEDTPVSEVEALFNHEECPEVESCEFAHNGYWYIKFKTDNDAIEAYLYLRQYEVKFKDKPVMARIKANSLVRTVNMSNQFGPGSGGGMMMPGGPLHQVQQNGMMPFLCAQQPMQPQFPVLTGAIPQFLGQQVQQPIPPFQLFNIQTVVPQWGPGNANPQFLDPGAMLAINGYQPASIKSNSPNRNVYQAALRNSTRGIGKPHRAQTQTTGSDRAAGPKPLDQVAPLNSPTSVHVSPGGRSSRTPDVRPPLLPTMFRRNRSEGPNGTWSTGGGGLMAPPVVTSAPMPLIPERNYYSRTHSHSHGHGSKPEPLVIMPSYPRRGGYRRPRPRGDDAPRMTRPQPPPDDKDTHFDLQDSAFPPLPGTSNNSSTTEAAEGNLLADVVKGVVPSLISTSEADKVKESTRRKAGMSCGSTSATTAPRSLLTLSTSVASVAASPALCSSSWKMPASMSVIAAKTPPVPETCDKATNTDEITDLTTSFALASTQTSPPKTSGLVNQIVNSAKSDAVSSITDLAKVTLAHIKASADKAAAVKATAVKATAVKATATGAKATAVKATATAVKTTAVKATAAAVKVTATAVKVTATAAQTTVSTVRSVQTPPAPAPALAPTPAPALAPTPAPAPAPPKLSYAQMVARKQSQSATKVIKTSEASTAATPTASATVSSSQSKPTSATASVSTYAAPRVASASARPSPREQLHRDYESREHRFQGGRRNVRDNDRSYRDPRHPHFESRRGDHDYKVPSK